MDRFIASLPCEADGDLRLCRDFGVAYQADQSSLAAYDEAYYNKCASYSGQEIARKINAGRVALVNAHLGTAKVVDVGIGSGEFIRNRPNTWGHDVNPAGIEWLKRNDLWAKNLQGFAGATFWDVLEHVPTPEDYFKQLPLHAFLFCSIPLFYALGAVRASKHYRPNEHLYYFTEQGFIDWMERHGFRLLEMQDFEIQAGRESIYSFAFRRVRWPTRSE